MLKKRRKIRMFFSISLVLILSLHFHCSVFGQTNSSFAKDTQRINKAIQIGRDYLTKGEYNNAMNYAITSEKQSKKINYENGVAASLNLKGSILYRHGDCDSAIKILSTALFIAKELNDSALQSALFLSIGNANMYLGNNSIGIDYYYQGLAIEEKLIKQINMQRFLSNLGTALTYQKNYSKALEYLLKAKKLAERSKNEKNLALIYGSLGNLYRILEKKEDAFYTLDQAIKMSEKIKDMYLLITSLNNMAQLQISFKNYTLAYQYCSRGYELAKAQLFKEEMAGCMLTFGMLFAEQHKYIIAENYLQKALAFFKEIKSRELIQDVSFRLSLIYEKQNDYKKAYDYYCLHSLTKDTLLNKENSKLITEMNTKYSSEKKEREIELFEKNKDLQRLELDRRRNDLEQEQAISIGGFFGFSLLMVVAILLFSRYRLKKNANDQLQKALILIEERNQVVVKNNALVTDSIVYAKRIQDTILPTYEDLVKIFPNGFFILYKPLQIVSGDFYWCSSHQNKTIFIVADCKENGVPGAFMSMIGNTLLNEIVNELKITDTKRIAELLDEKIIHALHQREGMQQHDDMDISICCIDKLANEIHFTGAHHSMYIFDGQITKVKGDPYSIGGVQPQKPKLFSSQTLSLKNGANLYIFTDGYGDQLSWKTNKFFTSEQFEKLLLSIQERPMKVQEKILEEAFEKWKVDAPQSDDILVVGIKC
jgi:tetratricopeptide (TPR) repeat protein